MKLKFIPILFIVLLLSLAAKATYIPLLLPGTTNNNAAYNSGTNGFGAVTNNFQVGVVPGASNVLWQLSSTLNAQPFLGTNGYLPALVFYPNGGVGGLGVGFPNTLYGPFNNTLIGFGFNLVATNASSTTVTVQWAGSLDGVYWQTNLITQTYVVPVNSLAPTNGIETIQYTALAWPMIALQQVNNPGVAAVTNMIIEVNGKPGL